jgi:hypothetical protein
MYVVITCWLSRNNFRSEKTELGQLTCGVTQSLKAAHGGKVEAPEMARGLKWHPTTN